MSAPRYERYKDSLAEWLGQVPEHWGVLPCRAIVVERNAKNEAAACEDYLSLMANVGVIPYAEKGDVGNKAPEDLSKCKVVAAGDIVINSMNYGIGSFGLSQLDGVCSPVYIVLRPINSIVATRFAFRLFANRAFQTYTQSYGNGILAHRAAISWDTLKAIPVPVPPIDEQLAILIFLDHETAKIDALVEEQRRLIDLLKEKRQAVISRPVTKGLNPNALMRDSGAGWVGQVPQHWRVSALGYAARIDSGSTPDRANPNFWGGSIPWIKTGEVNYDPITQAEECITEAGLQGSAAKVALPGTLLMAMYGQGVTRGRVALLEVPAAYNQACAAIHFDLAVAPSFGRYFFMAAYEHVRDGGNETSQMNLSTGAIQKFKIAVPPTPEQLAIVEFLDRSIREIDLLIQHADQSLILLLERRSALISAAVTGKIDVRGLVLQQEAVAA